MEQLPATMDRMIELPFPSDAQISPDGKWIAFTVGTVDWKENAYIDQIHLVASDGEAGARQLTFTKDGSSTPRWSPDSQHLIFLSKRHEDKGSQIYRLNINGGEAERLTEQETDIGNLAYSPDGESIAFVATSPESSKAKKRKETYGDYVEDNVDYQRSYMWLLRIKDKKVTQLTSGDELHVRDFAWSPDSQHIAINGMPAPDMGVLLETRIYLLDTQNLVIRPLTPRRTFSPCWSPDGTALVYQAGVYDILDGAFNKNAHLEIITIADDSIERVPTEFDEDLNPLFWSENGIYCWAFQRTSIQPFRVSLDGEIEALIPGGTESGFVSLDYSFDASGSVCGCVYTSPERVLEVASINVETKELRTLTDFDEPTREWDLPQHELFSWTSLDGTEIEGILTKPLDFDPEKQYPLMVAIHGGPTWISLRSKLGTYERRLYPLYQWVHQGAIVLQPNYRGGAGYGEAFRSLNVNDLGTGDYADVISGVDALIEEGYIDPERVASMGWSQGGYISAFITTYSDRFKAISVGAGISNWMTYYVNTDIHPFTINYLKATPWDDPEIYAKTSPMTYIKNAKTPTLIQHGEKDGRVPLPNAFELHQGLLDQGVQSKLVVYPGMPHGPRKPRQSRHIMMDNFNWFNHHIFGIEPEANDAAPLYIVLKAKDEKNKLIPDTVNLARRDDALFRVVTANAQLSENESDASDTPEIEDLNATIETLIADLKETDSKQIVFFSEKAENNDAVLLTLGCLQIAASRIGKIMVEHRAE